VILPMTRLRNAYALPLGLVLLGALALASIPTASNAAITEQEAHTLAVNAYVYFYPLITMDVTRRQFANREPGKRFDIDSLDPVIEKAFERVPADAQKLMLWKTSSLAQQGLGANLPGDAQATRAIHPLAPPDCSSPRATLTTFLAVMNEAVRLFKEGQKDEAIACVKRATRCLNLDKEPQALRHVVGLYSALYLKETLDRIEIPPPDEIPDAKAVQSDKLTGWTLPYTEITLALVKSESPSGTFLFTNETVRNAEKFYDRVKDLPYLPGTGGGALVERLKTSAGLFVPRGLINCLPEWTRIEVADQTVWQWIGLVLFLVMGAATAALLHKGTRELLGMLDGKLGSHLKESVGGLILPVTLVILAHVGLWFVVYGLHFQAENYLPVALVLILIFYVGEIWLIGAGLNRIAAFVITREGFAGGSADSQLIRLSFQALTIVVVIITAVKLGDRLGLPTYSLVTGLGVGGLAVALAGREALSNLIGTIIILLDQPFKLGDYIVLDDGVRGTVAEIGLRSTRIRTRDGILVSIPNASVAGMKIINQSAPVSIMRVHVPIGVAYGSDVKQVEHLLLAVAARSEFAVADPAPAIRFLAFGDSALQFELLIWIKRPEYRGRAIHQLNRAINEEFLQNGIEMPFPQREVHIRTDKEPITVYRHETEAENHDG
jgi:MscS family membrane protein